MQDHPLKTMASSNQDVEFHVWKVPLVATDPNQESRFCIDHGQEQSTNRKDCGMPKLLFLSRFQITIFEPHEFFRAHVLMY